MSEVTPTYNDLITALIVTLDEEIALLRKLVDDEESSCPARALRAERLRTLLYLRDLVETYETWEW